MAWEVGEVMIKFALFIIFIVIFPFILAECEMAKVGML